MRLFPVILFTACAITPAQENTAIKTGAEQIGDYVSLLQGKRIALVANHTSLIHKSHLADTLLSMDLKLVKIFSPEHGFRGDAGAGDIINNSIDKKTGLPIISLYGDHKKPRQGDFDGIDIVVYDIQDVGVRFYTYISTLHYIMEACSEHNVGLIVLDRPNPLGYYIDGPVLDTNYRSFVGMHPIPVVYAMTVGELSRMINGEKWLKGGLTCNLTVIPCKNYDHNMRYQLPVNPSPNLNTMEAVYLYPSLCFFEGTMMSLGRGTGYPFRVVGHPDFPLKDFSFIPKVNASNKNPVYVNKICYGIDFRNLTTDQLKHMTQINLKWLINAYTTMNKGSAFFTDYLDKLAGVNMRYQITSGQSEEQIRQSWMNGKKQFIEKRKKYLLYEDFR
jgi:uncharacterized protein YbbC (DUF1343 family)